MADKNKSKIKVTKDGPYEVTGNIPLNKLGMVPNEKGASVEYEVVKEYPRQETYQLCRCGESITKPYCDGSHLSGFDGQEKANHQTYDQKAHYIKGEYVDLMDAEEYCAGARFCDTKGGTWNLVTKPRNAETKEIVVQQCSDCPSGRLTAITKEGKKMEHNYPKEISVLEDIVAEEHGPIWVKGKIEVEDENGRVYPVRNRMTLCRCGQSTNKPFCNGNHLS